VGGGAIDKMLGAEPEKLHKSTIGSDRDLPAMSADVIAGGALAVWSAPRCSWHR
jgi:hypothetical protein